MIVLFATWICLVKVAFLVTPALLQYERHLCSWEGQREEEQRRRAEVEWDLGSLPLLSSPSGRKEGGREGGRERG